MLIKFTYHSNIASKLFNATKKKIRSLLSLRHRVYYPSRDDDTSPNCLMTGVYGEFVSRGEVILKGIFRRINKTVIATAKPFMT